MKTIWLSGGLYWHLMDPLRSMPGVRRVEPGFAGGIDSTATFESVLSGASDHRFCVKIEYLDTIVSTAFLLERFWRLIDPTDPNGQFRDRGRAYQPVVYVADEAMKREAEIAMETLKQTTHWEQPIAVTIEWQTIFVPASTQEASYHRDFPSRVERHDRTSGRADGLLRLWKTSFDPNTLKATLSPLSFHVTQKQGTEPPFRNAFWDQFEDGIYVDILSGEPLFCSLDKFDAGCGWPSFSKPIGLIRNKHDGAFGMIRTEVRTVESDIHLGHVFDDGPIEAGGLRYCINSAALRFIPKHRLVEEGYAPYLDLFTK